MPASSSSCSSSTRPTQHRPPHDRAAPAPGFFLLSCYVDVDAVLARLADLGLGGAPRRITVPAPGDQDVKMATVVDPDGVLVELIGLPRP